ncbi:hypothetical protein QSJ18_08390 [Gordonia sp. ABSL1-1]|uniref:hypothetical protein n=1 Tax=Gordonia sp. ABSL1-1 TaxID=3053923 RepID=UPI002572FA84|nr:hypothetical protein [Gordonia sp. ABSL1-1]MDL9936755.1 hypothetical protein [Gordonia sp. ABSL1-1]
MTTTTNTSNGLGFWKILGIIVLVILALTIIVPLLKGLFWIALIALAAYGAFTLLRSRSG